MLNKALFYALVVANIHKSHKNFKSECSTTVKLIVIYEVSLVCTLSTFIKDSESNICNLIGFGFELQ